MNDIKPVLLDAFEKECKNIMGNALNMYQRLATGTAVYPGQGTPLGLCYVALKGAGEAGEFAEHVGKAMRDDSFMDHIETHKPTGENPGEGDCHTFSGNVLTEERRELLIKEIGDQLWYLAAKCSELDITLSEAALINVHKLRDRQQRGTLRGSGDNR